MRVLHLCGRPSWDERFLRAMLRRDPNVDLVSFFILRTETDEQPWNHDELSLIPFPTFEIFEEQLRSFDLVIFQNFNFAPYGVEPFLPGVRDYVEEGGAIAMIGGDLSFASGGYGLDRPARRAARRAAAGAAHAGRGERSDPHHRFVQAPPDGRGAHAPRDVAVPRPARERARWGKLPPLEGINRVPRAKANAVTLLAHPTLKGTDGKPAPVLVAGDAGKGRSLALLTDSAWHWGFLAAGEGDDGRAFQRFWENAIRWLVRDPALTLLRIELERQEYRRTQPVTARVRAVHADYSPAREVDLQIVVVNTEQPDKPVRTLQATTNGDGEAQIDAGALPSGAYRVTGEATIDGRTVTEDKTFVVRADGRELDDVAARDRVLRSSGRQAAATTTTRSCPVSRSAPPARCTSGGRRRWRSGLGRRSCCWGSRSWRSSGRSAAAPGMLSWGAGPPARLAPRAAERGGGASGQRTAAASPATAGGPRRRTRPRPSCSPRHPTRPAG